MLYYIVRVFCDCECIETVTLMYPSHCEDQIKPNSYSSKSVKVNFPSDLFIFCACNTVVKPQTCVWVPRRALTKLNNE